MKVSSGDTLDFAEHVRQLFERKMESEVSPKSIQVQPSKKGNYISLSVSVFLLSEEQRRALYAALHEDPRIVYYL
ncbi:MAG: DUF493 domain-containing protein [Myxococcaceae bacterium]|nr:MAG: DUF493 domain-containing protein [Myxococcaceae bacterium]